MESKLLKNVEDKISLLRDDLIAELDESIRVMKADNSARGLLKSGATVRAVMTSINSIVEKYHSEITQHIKGLPFSHSLEFEDNVSKIVKNGFNDITSLAYNRLSDIADFAGKPELYQRVFPEVEVENRKSFQRFNNLLNAHSIELLQKANDSTKPWEIVGRA